MNNENDIKEVQCELDRLVKNLPNLGNTWLELGNWFLDLAKVQVRIAKLNMLNLKEK